MLRFFLFTLQSIVLSLGIGLKTESASPPPPFPTKLISPSRGLSPHGPSVTVSSLPSALFKLAFYSSDGTNKRWRRRGRKKHKNWYTRAKVSSIDFFWCAAEKREGVQSGEDLFLITARIAALVVVMEAAVLDGKCRRGFLCSGRSPVASPLTRCGQRGLLRGATLTHAEG